MPARADVAQHREGWERDAAGGQPPDVLQRAQNSQEDRAGSPSLRACSESAQLCHQTQREGTCLAPPVLQQTASTYPAPSCPLRSDH